MLTNITTTARRWLPRLALVTAGVAAGAAGDTFARVGLHGADGRVLAAFVLGMLVGAAFACIKAWQDGAVLRADVCAAIAERDHHHAEHERLLRAWPANVPPPSPVRLVTSRAW